jgi:hypothetical protein
LETGVGAGEEQGPDVSREVAINREIKPFQGIANGSREVHRPLADVPDVGAMTETTGVMP